MLNIPSQQWKAIWDADTTSVPLSSGCHSDFCQIKMILAQPVADWQKGIVPEQFLHVHTFTYKQFSKWQFHHYNIAMEAITLVCKLQSAPPFKSTSMTLLQSCSAAMCSAVQPFCNEANLHSYYVHTHSHLFRLCTCKWFSSHFILSYLDFVIPNIT